MIIYTKEQLKLDLPYKCKHCGHIGLDDFIPAGAAESTDYSQSLCGNPDCRCSIVEDDAVEGIDYVMEGREYNECSECKQNCLYEVSHSHTPGLYSVEYECANCGYQYSISA